MIDRSVGLVHPGAVADADQQTLRAEQTSNDLTPRLGAGPMDEGVATFAQLRDRVDDFLGAGDLELDGRLRNRNVVRPRWRAEA